MSVTPGMDTAVVYRSIDPIENLKVRVTLEIVRQAPELLDPAAEAELDAPEPEAEPDKEALAAEAAAAAAKIEELKPKLEETKAKAEAEVPAAPEEGAEAHEEADKAREEAATAKEEAAKELAAQQAELAALEKTLAEATAKLEAANAAPEPEPEPQAGGGEADPDTHVVEFEWQKKSTASEVVYAYIDGDQWEEFEVQDHPICSEVASAGANKSGKKANRAAELIQKFNTSEQIIDATKTERSIFKPMVPKRMRIVAKLPAPDGEKFEKTLCFINGYKVERPNQANNYILEMRPGFGSSHSFAFLGSMYKVTVEAASAEPDKSEVEDEVTKQIKERERKRRLADNRRGRHREQIYSEIKPTSEIWWDVFTQVCSAEGFKESDRLYVEFRWDLPPTWQLNPNPQHPHWNPAIKLHDRLDLKDEADVKSRLSGTTQLASAEYGSFDIFGLHPVYCLGQAHEMQLVQSEGWHYKPAGPDAVGAPARGPLTTDAMRALYASGSLPPTTLVRRQCAAAGEPDAGGVNDAKWVEVAGVATIAVAGPEAVDRGATEPSTAAAVQAEPSAASRPTLYLRVCTVDSWERFRLLGYGLVALPQAAGRLKLSVPTWRPASDRLANLRTAFVGGSPELEPWCPAVGIPQLDKDFRGGYLSKFGQRTVASGTVTVELNLVSREKKLPLPSNGTRPGGGGGRRLPPLRKGTRGMAAGLSRAGGAGKRVTRAARGS